MTTAKEITEYLIEKGFTANKFGVIIVSDGTNEFDLTYYVAEALEEFK